MMKAILRLMNYNSIFLKYLYISFFLFIYSYNSWSQQSESNREYVENKTNELTNDSSYWDNDAVIYFGANRTALYNWSAGGMNYLEFHGLTDLWFDYRHNKFHWNNFIGMSFGIMKSSYGNFANTPWWKNDDRLEMTSKFSRRTPHLWDYSFLFNFRTQFTFGYYTEDDMLNQNYMDNFFAPVYPITGFGFDIHANDYLTAYLSPITIKSTIVLDDSLSQVGVFGVNAGQNFRSEAGMYVNLLYRHDSLFHNKKLSLMTDLSLFSNYLNKPGNIDITWEQLITYKFSKYFSITFSGYLIYDHDIKIPRYQSDGITPIYLTRSNDQLDPITGDNHYFFDYDNPNANNYVVNYVSNDTNGDGLFTDPGEYEGWKIIKTGAATQFMEFWMIGLSFTF